VKRSIKPQPRRRKNPATASRRFHPWTLTGLTLGVFILLVMAYLWLHFQIIQISYDIARAQNQKKELMETNKKLRIQLANLKSPERIEQIAMTRLGLRPPGKGQVEIIK
jgi:cell division protein FtsL